MRCVIFMAFFVALCSEAQDFGQIYIPNNSFEEFDSRYMQRDIPAGWETSGMVYRVNWRGYTGLHGIGFHGQWAEHGDSGVLKIQGLKIPAAKTLVLSFNTWRDPQWSARREYVKMIWKGNGKEDFIEYPFFKKGMFWEEETIYHSSPEWAETMDLEFGVTGAMHHGSLTLDNVILYYR